MKGKGFSAIKVEVESVSVCWLSGGVGRKSSIAPEVRRRFARIADGFATRLEVRFERRVICVVVVNDGEIQVERISVRVGMNSEVGRIKLRDSRIFKKRSESRYYPKEASR